MLGCILLQREHLLHVCRRTENFTIIIDQETQNRTWLPYFNWNYVNIYLHYQYDISVIVAWMSLGGREHAVGGWSLLPVMGGGAFCWGIIFKILVGLGRGGEAIQIRDCVTLGVIFVNFTFWPWHVRAGIIFLCFETRKGKCLPPLAWKTWKTNAWLLCRLKDLYLEFS